MPPTSPMVSTRRSLARRDLRGLPVPPARGRPWGMDELPEAVALTPTSFRTDHRPSDVEAELASLVLVLDLQAANPAVRRLRAWARDELAPRPGATAVDVGAGTGEEVQAFASLVWPTGRAIGVEPYSGLRQEAQRRAAGTGATYVDGDARALPFED